MKPNWLPFVFADIIVLSIASPARALDFVWDGGDVINFNWSDDTNWNPDAVPSAGSRLIFPSGVTGVNLGAINDFPTGTAFSGLRFTGGGYTLSGNAINLGADGIVADVGGSSNDTVNLTPALTIDQTWTATGAGNLLTVQGNIDLGVRKLVTTGAGWIVLGGTTSGSVRPEIDVRAGVGGGLEVLPTGVLGHPFTTGVTSGALILNGTMAAGSLQVRSGAILGGTGTARAVTCTGGTLAPGATRSALGFGLLSTGNLSLDAASTLKARISKPASQTLLATLAVTGTVALGGATLDLNLATPPDGIFTLIANDGIDPVSGSFAGMPEGFTFAAGSKTVILSYAGGDGNDVAVLIHPQPTGVTRILKTSGGNWGSAGNWQDGVVPVEGDAVELPVNGSTMNAVTSQSSNNLPAFTFLDRITARITVTGTGQHLPATAELDGNPLAVGPGGIHLAASSEGATTFRILNAIRVVALQTWTVDQMLLGNGQLRVGGAVDLGSSVLTLIPGARATIALEAGATGTSAGGFTLEQGFTTSVVTLTGVQPFAHLGATRVKSGVLAVSGNVTSSPTIVTGGRLTGDGSLARLEMAGGGTVEPSGILETGSVAFTRIETPPEAPRFGTLRIGFPPAGIGEARRLAVTGSVQLDATLSVAPDSRPFQANRETVIIANDGTDPVSGVFVGLPEGAIVRDAAGVRGYSVRYAGGDGNDVSLTEVSSGRTTWVGGTAGNVWSAGANWQRGTPPISGDVLEFPIGLAPSRLASVNDLVSGVFALEIGTNVQASISGNTLRLTRGSGGSGEAAATLACPVEASAEASETTGFLRNFASVAALDLGTHAFRIEGAVLNGAVTGTVPATLSLGSVRVLQSVAPGVRVIVSGGNAVIAGPISQGFTASVVDFNNSFVGSRVDASGSQGPVSLVGSMLSAGDFDSRARPGSLTIEGMLDCQRIEGVACALEFQVEGTAAGSGHDRITVNDAVFLGDAGMSNTLLFVRSAPGVSLPVNTILTILDNAGSDPVSGIFAGFPEGATVRPADSLQDFRISYVGGTGNDITLTALTAPQPGNGAQVTSFSATPENLFGNDVFRVMASGAAAPGSTVRMEKSGNLINWTIDTSTTVNPSGAWSFQLFIPRTEVQQYFRFAQQ